MKLLGESLIMKNFRWVINGLFLFLSLTLSLQLVRASDIHDKEPDPKKLALLQIPLSILQALWADKNLVYDKVSRHHITKELRGFEGFFYQFSIFVDPTKGNPEVFTPYFEHLADSRYSSKKILPMIMRIWRKTGNGKTEFYQGTYELNHTGLPPFRFHLITISKERFAEFSDATGVYLFGIASKKSSVALREICEAEYTLSTRATRLEDLLGEKIAGSKIRERKKRSFKSKRKQNGSLKPDEEQKLDTQPLSSPQALSLSDLNSSDLISSPISSPQKTHKVQYSLLGEEIEDILNEIKRS